MFIYAFRGIAITPENRAIIVREGIMDPLVLMARSDEIEIQREVAAALCNLSSMEENKVEITDRAISTIITLLLSGDAEVARPLT